jgi:D-alanyl-D-alanine carboxypeptidase/D-alanyl-D-alanine-endopeptidase (penicillin-binding protein 4)
MRTAAALIAALVLTLVAATAPPAGAVTRAELRAQLAREFRLAGPGAGAYARDLETGEVLFAARPDVPRVPASLEKLFVTATAFLRLGPDGVLQTRAITTFAPDEAGVVAGDLALVGAADPTLDGAALVRLAEEVADAGVTEVRGRLVVDATPFALPAGAGGRFVRALRQEGVVVRGGVVAGRRPIEGTGVVVASVAWRSVRRLAASILVPSDNALAERLLAALGVFAGAATRPAGAAVVRDTLDDLGVRPLVVDGSGLSTGNRTTPRQVVRLLERVVEGESGAEFRSALAVPGRNGTVRRRMRGTSAAGRCAVKTGTLRTVSALAGVCTTTGGREVGFAWMMNGTYPPAARVVQDRMTTRLARYSG